MSLSSLTKHYYAGQFKGRDLSVFWHSLGVVFFRFVFGVLKACDLPHYMGLQGHVRNTSLC